MVFVMERFDMLSADHNKEIGAIKAENIKTKSMMNDISKKNDDLSKMVV